jgi:hypothetical protein
MTETLRLSRFGIHFAGADALNHFWFSLFLPKKNKYFADADDKKFLDVKSCLTILLFGHRMEQDAYVRSAKHLPANFRSAPGLHHPLAVLAWISVD